jgi:hypothetical protein
MLHAHADAVVSCHVERVTDDDVWSRFHALLRERPAGFAITPLLRPPHEGEDHERWLERARAAAELGPIGHHTHFAAPEHARPRAPADVGRVRREAEWLGDVGLRPAFFCGGGWYSDAEVAETVAERGYVDCTALGFSPAYLQPDRRHLRLERPSWVRLASGRRLLELPSTHSIGMILRALPRRRLDAPLVHVYFHDTDLLDPRRRTAIRWALRLLALRRKPSDLATAAGAAARAPEVPFEAALRD